MRWFRLLAYSCCLLQASLLYSQTPDTSAQDESNRQLRLLYETEMEKQTSGKKEKPISSEGFPTRFFISIGGGVKAYAGAFDRFDAGFYRTIWSPYIQQHLGYRFNLDLGERNPRGNAFGVFYRYGKLSHSFANRFMQEQIPTAPPFIGECTFLDAGLFLVAAKRMGLTLMSGHNRLEWVDDKIFVNRYYAVGLQFMYNIRQLELEVSLTSMFNKFTVHPCLSTDFSIRYNIEFWRF